MQGNGNNSVNISGTTWNLSGVTSFNNMFTNCTSLSGSTINDDEIFNEIRREKRKKKLKHLIAIKNYHDLIDNIKQKRRYSLLI